mmetsp:Transcript_9710/g.18290  ORF Transcript_9710/g.18290 Transcript_9710/m.18290 type:complete len:786 (+) Transcript_9710:229-2586(+)
MASKELSHGEALRSVPQGWESRAAEQIDEKIDLFPVLLAKQSDPALRSLTITVVTLNAGLVTGWTVGVVTGQANDMTAVLAGVIAVIIFSIASTLAWYFMLRTRYGLSFYLLGQELPGSLEEDSVHVDMEGAAAGKTGSQVTASLATLPGAADAREEEDDDEEAHMHIRMEDEGPREEDILHAENRIRQAMEDGAASEIGKVVRRFAHLLAAIQPDLLWAAELLQLRLAAATLAVERAREQAEAVEAAHTLGGGLPTFSARRQMRITTAGSEDAAGPVVNGGREALADTVDKYVLQLHDIESSTEKARQEKRDLLKQMDALRMAVEQLKIYRLVQKDELAVAARIGGAVVLQESSSRLKGREPAAALRLSLASATSDRYMNSIADLCDASKLCENSLHQIETFLDVSAYAARFPSVQRSGGDVPESDRIPEPALTYFVAGATERGLVHKPLLRDKCILTYGAAQSNKTLHITALTQAKPKVHFWFGAAGKKAGHLLLVPISMGPNEPVLGILVVDTIAKSRKTNEFCPITHEEKATVQFAAQRMAECLTRSREAASQTQAALLEAINRETEGKAGKKLQHMELLRQKSRLDTILSDGSPEARACLVEIRGVKQPPRDVLAVACAALALLRSGHELEGDWSHASLESSLLPSSPQACAAFWVDTVQKRLLEFHDNLIVALQAVDYRAADDQQRRFEMAAAYLDTVSSYGVAKGYALVAFLLPWMRCTVALHQIVVTVSNVTEDSGRVVTEGHTQGHHISDAPAPEDDHDQPTHNFESRGSDLGDVL